MMKGFGEDDTNGEMVRKGRSQKGGVTLWWKNVKRSS